MTPSSSTVDAVIDTVVLRYFLFVGHAELLLHLLGEPLGVPRTVFDPDEGEDVPEDVMSELRRSRHLQVRRSNDSTRSSTFRQDAAHKAAALHKIDPFVARGSFQILDMSHDERRLFSRFVDFEEAASFGLKVSLGMGEAACIALAVSRGLVLATDDNDALIALRTLNRRAPHTRIRALLRRAATEGHIDETDANTIHRDMRRLGFWDTEDPFPDAN